MPYKIKVQFKDEDYTIRDPPSDLSSLLDLIPKGFRNKLPAPRVLKYHDSQSDLVTLTNQEGYQAMMDSDDESKTKIRKIMIVPVDEDQEREKSCRASTMSIQGTKKSKAEAANTKTDKTKNQKTKPVSSDNSEEESESSSESGSESENESSGEDESLAKPTEKVNFERSMQMTDMSLLNETKRTVLKDDTELKIEDLTRPKKKKVLEDSEEEDDSEESSSESSDEDANQKVKPTKNPKAPIRQESLDTTKNKATTKNGAKLSKMDSKLDLDHDDIDIDIESLRRQIRDDFKHAIEHVAELAVQEIKEYVHKTLEEHIPARLYQQKEKKIKEQNKLLNSLSTNVEQMQRNLTTINKRVDEESVAQTRFMKKLEEKFSSKEAPEPLREKNTNIPKDKKKKTSHKQIISSDSDDSPSPVLKKKSPPKKKQCDIDSDFDSPSVIPKPKGRNQKGSVLENSNMDRENKGNKPQKSKGPVYDVAFSGQDIKTIPPEITPKLGKISKPIKLKNTGTKPWPEGCTFETFGGLKGETVKMPSLNPGSEPINIILMMDGPREPGEFVVPWKLTYKDSSGKKHDIGEPYFLTLSVLNKGRDDNGGARMMDSDSMEEEKEPNHKNGRRINIREEIENMDDLIIKKVKQIKLLKRDVDEEALLIFITKNPEMPVETIIDSLGIFN